MHTMVDIETLGTTPDSTILTIAAQAFNPFATGYYDQHFYARIDTESQPNRTIDDGTVSWWANQPAEAQSEAFGEDNRIPLPQALDELGKLIWHSKMIWINGVGFDTTILEHAYRENKIKHPWSYYNVRDCRTVFGLWPELPKPPTSHHSLEDCRRQIDMLQSTLKHLGIKEIR